MSFTATTLNAVLKELITNQDVADLAFDSKARPFLTALTKETDFAGYNKPYPLLYEHGAGDSATFSTAQTNIGSAKYVAWDMDVVAAYTVHRITTDALLRARNDKGAFIRGLKAMLDSAVERRANAMESNLFKSRDGAIGTISSISSGIITLSDAEDVSNFYVGQVLRAAANNTSSLESGTGYVIELDRDAGTVTVSSTSVSGSAGTPTGFSSSDLLFNEGDYVSSSDRLKMAGLADWLPSSAPDSTAFFGVARNADVTRLGGHRLTGSLSDIEGAIIAAAARLGKHTPAFSPDVAWMSFETYRLLVNELGSKVVRDPGGDAKGGFEGIMIYGPQGIIKCRPASKCPGNLIYLLSMKTWALISMEQAPMVLDQDGMRVQRVSNADALEVRIASFSNLVCKAPGANARISLS